MKAKILDINGKEKGSIELPKFFSEKIREDIVAKVLESKKIKQPYSPGPLSGNKHVASGIFSHRRKVWKSDRGQGASRIPRKIFSRKGSQFSKEGATIPSTRGGRRAHPPKILHQLSRKKINKSEMKIALKSALSATANEQMIRKKYSTLGNGKINSVPFVVEAKLLSLKTKDFIKSIGQIVGENLANVSLKKKSVRSGIGKLRGRRYKRNAGMLIVIGKKEKINANVVDVARVEHLGVLDLARGGLGRVVIYSEDAIKELNEKIGK
jgi:large subunit ribosomal protein L4e